MWQVHTIRLDLPHAPTPQSLKRGLVCAANIRNPNDKKQAGSRYVYTTTFNNIRGWKLDVPPPLYVASMALISNLSMMSLTMRTGCESGISSPKDGGSRRYIKRKESDPFTFGSPSHCFYLVRWLVSLRSAHSL